MNEENNIPSEVANLLNPAFCGDIILRACIEYSKRKKEGMPYPLVFLILPIILHKKTREKITPKMRMSMHNWLESNQEAKLGFPERASSLLHITKESMIFLLQTKYLSIDTLGNVHSQVSNRPSAAELGEEVVDCYKKATIVGKWFAQNGSSATTYSLWGVKP
jgi:hypothetical protein